MRDNRGTLPAKANFAQVTPTVAASTNLTGTVTFPLTAYWQHHYRVVDQCASPATVETFKIYMKLKKGRPGPAGYPDPALGRLRRHGGTDMDHRRVKVRLTGGPAAPGARADGGAERRGEGASRLAGGQR